MPGCDKRSYILNQNQQLKAANASLFKYNEHLLPPATKWLKLLYLMPSDNKKSYIFKPNKGIWS